jgi:hypothetical protein
MYKIEITRGSSTITIFSPEITVKNWGFRINAPAPFVFSIPISNPKANEDNLQHMNRITFYRKSRDGRKRYVPEWYGYIEAVNQVDNAFEVLCTGALGIFRKRYTLANESLNGAGSADAFDLLARTNTDDGPTGIAEGTGGVTDTSDLTVNEQDILSALEKKAASVGAEFEIDVSGKLNFVPSLGTDKTGLKLVYRLDGRPGTNVSSFTFGEDAGPMANRIVGKNSAGSTSTKDDGTSQTKYGIVLVEHKTFTEANDQDTLDSMTQAYLSQRAYPITDIAVVPDPAAKRFNPLTGLRETSGIQYGDISIGDLITLEVVTQSRQIHTAKRIAEISVSVDENGHETMSLTLSKAGVFVTADYLDATEYGDLKRTVQKLEALIS